MPPHCCQHHCAGCATSRPAARLDRCLFPLAGLLLLGDAYMVIPQGAAFTDPGVVALDNSGSESVSTFASTTANLQAALFSTAAAQGALGTRGALLGPFVITYSAVDASGNIADPVRRTVYVDTACPEGEYRCDDARCSSTGLCGVGAFKLPGAPVVQTHVVVAVDTEPPVLTLRGDAPDNVRADASGAAVMITTVAVVSAWQDPGCAALDAVDGEVSVTSRGAGAIVTSRPTLPDRPYLVRAASLLPGSGSS